MAKLLPEEITGLLLAWGDGDRAALVSAERAADLLALDEALTSLAAIDPRKSQLVELKYFGGLTTEEAAAVLGVSTPTVERDWRTAKIWLHREISKTGRRDEGMT